MRHGVGVANQRVDQAHVTVSEYLQEICPVQCRTYIVLNFRPYFSLFHHGKSNIVPLVLTRY